MDNRLQKRIQDRQIDRRIDRQIDIFQIFNAGCQVLNILDAINLGLIIIHIGEEQKFEPKFEEQKDPFDLLVMNRFVYFFQF